MGGIFLCKLRLKQLLLVLSNQGALETFFLLLDRRILTISFLKLENSLALGINTVLQVVYCTLKRSALALERLLMTFIDAAAHRPLIVHVIDFPFVVCN